MAKKTREQKEFEETYEKFFNIVYKIAFIHVKKNEDALDISQDVFFKYYISDKEFSSSDHLKAWLITCTRNACMDYFRAKIRKNVSLEEIGNASLPFEIDETLIVLLGIPDKYKDPIYMHYYEGYSTEEIAKILHKPRSTIRVNLHRGRSLMRRALKRRP